MTDKNNTRVASLDGARAVSIALVVFSHMQSSLPLLWRIDRGNLALHYDRYLDLGNLGVRVFFVISGFLITSLLVREQLATGRISLKQFYLRRFFRIMPAYWVYLGTVAVLMTFGIATADWHKLTEAFLYFGDYRWLAGALSHTWSLSVEEQFYLLWAPLLVLLGNWRVRYACLALLLAGPTFRMLSDGGMWSSSSKYAFECVCDALASGCALALFRKSLWRIGAYQEAIESGWPWYGAITALALMTGFTPYWVRDLIGIPLLNVSIVVLLDKYMRYPELGFGRFLNARPVIWVGVLSYSIYLWQELFAWAYIPALAKTAGILATASASYYLIERPLLGLRARLRAKPIPPAIHSRAAAP
ncbi:MAG TPA: acyltransferase [Steroidobacteraceae bacterium]|nr:acyltransferase [Steroidobacteraceae bacterium]